MDRTVLDYDTQLTLRNRERLINNKNLLFWYKKLYESQFEGIPDIRSKKILEIGSGTSPLSFFYPKAITSDVMRLDHLQYVFDAHDIDAFDKIEEASLDIITMTNVLHHLKDPLLFMTKAAKKLKHGGKLIFTEPYFSLVSRIIYIYLHHEPTDFGIKKPVLEKVEGPLSSANIALPYLIFIRQWDAPLREVYTYSMKEMTYFTSISYMATGGISRKIMLPGFLYRAFFYTDLMTASRFPWLAASFFTMRLTKR